MMHRAAALVFCLLATPAFADAVTYRGDLNSLPIVVEFSQPPQSASGTLYARYFYVSEGIDIPMHATAISPTELRLAVELPCEDENCAYGGDIPDTIPQIQTTWTLAIADNGAALIGDAGSEHAPIHLERTGSRPYEPSEETPADLAVFATSLYYSGETLTRDTSPYDFLKVNVALDHSGRVRAKGVEYDYVADPRTLFKYPRVHYIDGADIEPVNHFLEQRDWTMRLDALNCRAMMYPGMGWSPYGGWAYGSLGGYEEELVEVKALTRTIMSWTESGSLDCGGAHPYNHDEIFNLDVKTGQRLDLSRIFAGWRPMNYDGTAVDLETARANPREYEWLPDAALAGFVKQHRISDEQLDIIGGPDGCMMDELIDTNLVIGFKDKDIVVFATGNLPHVAFACTAVLYEAPIAELRALLSPEAGDYFPSLGG